MKEDEYIDLDKINAMPKEGEAPGFLKEEKSEQKPEEKPKKQEIKQKQPKTAKNKETKKKTTKKTKTAKKAPEKTKIIKRRKTSKSNNKKVVYFLLGIILLAIIVLLVASLFRTTPETEEKKALFLINGELMMQDEVETRANWLRLVNGIPITDEQAIELSIDVELMYQEAKRRNITITDEEVNKVFEDMRMSAGMSEEELIDHISGLGIRYDLLKQTVKKEMHARELSFQELSAQLTEERKLEYYNENLDQFAHDELAVIRQIQLNFNAERTENQTLELANEIKQQIDENRTNFCELALEYSDDLNTKFDCEEYVFEKQPESREELMEKSFLLEDDEIAIVKSLAGYHIIWKIETIPAGVSEFEDVKWRIETLLEMEIAEEVHFKLLEQLRENATIEDYTGKLDETQETEEPTEVEIPGLIEIPEDTEVIEIDTEDSIRQIEEAIDQALKDIMEEVEDVEEVEEVEEIEETVSQPYETAPQPATTDNRELRLAKCLTDKGAKMYTVFWSPHGQQQAEAFGDYFEHIISIECDPDGVNPKVAECKNAIQKEFPVWPTWIINGELHEGSYNLHQLARISGCPY